MLYDFHSHILPGVDDGSNSIEQSITILNMLRESDVRTVVATPHFYYSHTDVPTFLKERDEAYNKLMAAIEPGKYPHIVKGAEVLLTTDIADMEGLEKLCIENTSYILIELPYSYWSGWVFRALEDIISRGLKPIIAHIDRYTEATESNLANIFYLKCLIQLNVDSIVNKRTKRKVLKYIKYGGIQLLGSDTHDDVKRPPKFNEAMVVLRKKFGPEIEQMFENNSLYVLNNM